MKKAIGYILILGVALAMWVGVFALDYYQYNDGTCRKCHGQYEFFDVERNKDSLPLYYFRCDDCGHVCETYFQY